MSGFSQSKIYKCPEHSFERERVHRNIVFDVVNRNIVFDVDNRDIAFDVVNRDIVSDVVNLFPSKSFPIDE